VGTADGERIAPVTWLFGDKPQQSETERLSPSAVSPVIVGPSFREKEPRAEKGRFDPINNVSMHALARRGMSSREMHEYLTGREFEPHAIDAEIERLEGVGLLDDGQLAETLVRTLRERKGLGRAALNAELRRRHLAADAVENALGSLDDDELQRAVEIAIKRAPQLRSLDDSTARRRLGAFLMRKGYSGSVVSTAVAHALESSGPVFR
jgi:regulatory protein